jgi:[CysO sulfur-carrier protein]-S-L-cysteine hydrolase
MAEATIRFTPDTEYLEQVARTIGEHLTALADDLAKLRTARQGDDKFEDAPAEEKPAGLRIPRSLWDAMLAHCRAEHPIESCGVIAGPRGADLPDRIIPMVNAEQSHQAYRFDPDQQLAVWQEMHDRSERPVVIYHSHTASQPHPSKLDIQHATVPEAHWVIVSTRDRDGDLPMPPEVRSFRIVGGEVEEEPITVV